MLAVRVGTVCRAKTGETVSGDAAVFWQDERATLVAVIDGLGSGTEAAQASQAAVAYLANHWDGPVGGLVTGCHAALHGTRGAVLALVRFEHRHDRMTFVGVGNIGFSAATTEPMQPVSNNGLVGQRLPHLNEFTFSCRPGDIVALYSDGISKEFLRRGGLAGLTAPDWTEPRRVAERMADHFAREEDDVGVAVVTIGVSPTQSPTWSRG